METCSDDGYVVRTGASLICGGQTKYFQKCLKYKKIGILLFYSSVSAPIHALHFKNH